MAWARVKATPIDALCRGRHAGDMSAVFDTHKAVKALKEAGFDDSQAEAVVTTVGDAMTGNVATKADIAGLRSDIIEARTFHEADIAGLKADMREIETQLKGDMAEIKADILKWMFGALLGQAALIIALVKLL